MKKIKQINNLTIKHSIIEGIDCRGIGGPKIIFNKPSEDYAVFAPNGTCLEDRLTLEQAGEFCRETLDFTRRKKKLKLA